MRLPHVVIIDFWQYKVEVEVEVDLGCYLEGQGHSMTLQQNHVQPITSLFEVGFQNYFTEMIIILRIFACVQNLFGEPVQPALVL